MKTKILYIIDKLKLAGAQLHLLELIKNINKDEFDIRLCCLNNKENLNHFAGISVFDLGVNRIYGLSGIRGLFKLIKFIKKEKFDIVQTFLFSENILGVIAAKLAGVKVIITSRRGTGKLMHGKWRHILAYRITNIWVNKIICVSNAVKEVVKRKEKVPEHKLVTIYNGVDINRFQSLGDREQIKKSLGIKANELVVGMIANFNWIKGHKDFIEAVKIVLKELPNTKFLLIGDGPLKDSLQSTVHSQRLEDKILFLGKRRDIPNLLSVMDVSVNASYSEGMSNSILESMATGVPVVATAVDGNLETVADGITGILVSPKNPKTMAGAIIKILKDKELAKNMKINAIKTIKDKFTSEIMTGNVEKLYKNLLKRKIAFIISQFPSIPETFILRELRTLKERGIDIKILSLKPCRDNIIHHEARELMGETVYGKAISYQLSAISLTHPIKTLKTLFYVFTTYCKQPKELIKALYVWLECLYLVRFINKEHITHIHSHWATMPTTAAMILSKLTGISFSFTAHAWDIFLSDKQDLYSKLNNAKFAVTCTGYNRKYLLEEVARTQRHNDTRHKSSAKRSGASPKGTSKRLSEKIYLNYHGLEREWFADTNYKLQTTNYNPLRILAIGRLVEQKGFEYLIQACKILKDKGVDFECSIVGDGPLKKSLSAMSYDLRANVKLLGTKTREEIKKLYRNTDVFVAPSVIAKNGDRDGIPNVMLEAMAMSIPVIGTDVSGLPEVLIHEKTGLVVPERNSKALSQAIERLASDSNLRKKFSEMGKRHISEHFDLNKNVDNLIKIIDQNITANRKRHTVNRIKVLYIIWSLEPGGAERVVLDLSKYIDRNKFQPTVLCINKPGRLSYELIKKDIPVIYLNKKGKIDLKALFKLIRILRKYKFDIIHTHMFTANFWGRIANIFSGNRPLIITEHNLDTWKTPFHFLIDKVLLRFTKKAIFVSKEVRNFYEKKVRIPQNMSFVCHNGIDASRLNNGCSIRKSLGIGENVFLIGSIGRLVPQKDFKNFLMAFSKVREKRKDVEAIVVGDGPQCEELIKLRDSLGLSNSVKFLGARDDISDILSSINLLVVSSEREGLSISILEAMFMGVPIVATAVGGNSECIINEETGLLVPPKDAEALSQAILKVINDRNKLKQMGSKAKGLFEDSFTVDKMIKIHEKVYADVI